MIEESTEISNWEYTKKTSAYHFDNTIMDYRWDALQGVGRFEGDWSAELAESIQTAEPVTWRTRLNGTFSKESPMIDQEEYDLISAGADPNLILLRYIANACATSPWCFDIKIACFCIESEYLLNTANWAVLVLVDAPASFAPSGTTIFP